jgi:hypothetical protein
MVSDMAFYVKFKKRLLRVKAEVLLRRGALRAVILGVGQACGTHFCPVKTTSAFTPLYNGAEGFGPMNVSTNTVFLSTVVTM